MVDANGKKYENNCVNNVANKQEDWDTGQQSVPSFKLVSNSDPAPTQSCSQASIDNAIQYLYTKLVISVVNEKKTI